MKSHHLRGRIVGLVLASFVSLAIAGQANASTVGEPISLEFNYVALYLGTHIAGDIDSLVTKPPADPLQLNGTYTDDQGNFSVPEDGLDPVTFTFDPGPFPIDAELALTEEGSGKFDPSTGDMTLDLSMALTLGVDDLEEVSKDVGVDLGTGSLSCRLAPLSMEFSTVAEWPHPGKAFADPGSLTDGALAGAWRTKPVIVAEVGGQDVCNVLGGFLKPIGGIWLANSSTEITDFPDWHIVDPPECPDAGSLLLYCLPPGWEEPQHPCGGCPKGGEGQAEITGLKLNPPRANLKVGSSRVLTLSLRNTGDEPADQLIRFGSSNRRVSIRRTLKVPVPAGTTVTRKVKVTAGSRAGGQAVITASTSGLKAKSTLLLKRPAKRR